DEIGIDDSSGKTVVRINPLYYRPAEVDQLLGDASKAKAVLGWEPKVKFKQLVELMLEGELRFFKDQRYQLGF
ncbi:MAG TPA: GDP-mannose 4,6-dehydratase, partial [Lentisphaeria bacterium]|nr:GDP-mannose 4,6-dehydratase [Lentisphaeria bacterium]